MPRLSSVDKERTIKMLYSELRPAEVLERFHVHKSTILHLIQLVKDTEATKDHPRSFRPTATTSQQDHHRASVHVPGWLL